MCRACAKPYAHKVRQPCAHKGEHKGVHKGLRKANMQILPCLFKSANMQILPCVLKSLIDGTLCSLVRLFKLVFASVDYSSTTTTPTTSSIATTIAATVAGTSENGVGLLGHFKVWISDNGVGLLEHLNSHRKKPLI